MITLEQFGEIGIAVSDALVGNAALEYIANNTTLKVDLNDVETVKALPFLAKLFITKFEEVDAASSVIASESIEGLSQSFKMSDKRALLDDLANTYLDEWLKGKIKFYPATKRWK